MAARQQICGIALFLFVLGCNGSGDVETESAKPLAIKDMQVINFEEIGVSLPCPPTYQKSNGFYGITNAEGTVHVRIDINSNGFTEVIKNFNSIPLRERSMILDSRENLEVEGMSAQLLHVSQEIRRRRLLKWIYVVGNDERTLMVTATFTADLADEVSEQMKQIVKSLNITKEHVEIPPADVSNLKYVSFPMVGVEILQPENFEISPRFPGFINSEDGSIIKTISMPAPFENVIKSFTKEGLAMQKMKLVREENITVDGSPALLLNATRQDGDKRLENWVVLFASGTETKMVQAEFPKTTNFEPSELFKAIVIHSKLIGANSADGTAIQFTITPSGKLKETKRVGFAQAFTFDGTLSQEVPTLPRYYAAPSLGNNAVANKRFFTSQRLYDMAGTNVGTVISDQAITVDGLSGYEMVAEANDQKTGAPLNVYLVVLYEEDRFYILRGVVGTDMAEEYLPEFKKMTHSFKRIDPSAEATTATENKTDGTIDQGEHESTASANSADDGKKN
jgi:hypothetical protein